MIERGFPRVPARGHSGQENEVLWGGPFPYRSCKSCKVTLSGWRFYARLRAWKGERFWSVVDPAAHRAARDRLLMAGRSLAKARGGKDREGSRHFRISEGRGRWFFDILKMTNDTMTKAQCPKLKSQPELHVYPRLCSECWRGPG
jgi:hypothetical protein